MRGRIRWNQRDRGDLMKLRLAGGVLALSLLFGCAGEAGAVNTSAAAAILMDAGSGRVLYGHNIHDQRLIASITKLMTALVALESGVELSQEVTVAPEWVGVEGSSIYLREGETLTLETLLYGMLLRSGNDAALAVAEVCGGSEESFVARMNEKARALGMENSHFVNPNGLNDEAHYSSAYDMALLARACLENETLREMVSTKSISLGGRSFTNHNKLLWQYEGCIGLKTGYTEKAGRTLVSAAERDGMTLICVTLSDPNDWADHAALFDWGFSSYRLQTVAQAGESMGQLPVEGSLVPVCPLRAGEKLSIALKEGEQIETQLCLDCTSLTAPVAEGKKVGEIVCRLNGEEVGRVPLETGEAATADRVQSGHWIEKILARIAAL